MTEDFPAPPMQHHGHHPETLATDYSAGYCAEHPCPAPTGKLSEVLVKLHDTRNGRHLVIGMILFGPDGRQEDADMGGVDAAVRGRWLPDDPRVRAFLAKYPAKLPHLGALQLQRECPVQLPYGGPLVVMPGDVEVIG